MPSLAGRKRAGRPSPLQKELLHCNAIESHEINAVDLAFSKRPDSPENYRIYQDKDVNGAAKCVDFIGIKYRYAPLYVKHESELPDYSNSQDELYCICREPYDITDKRPQRKMFQCDGPCQKWVHPSCFGETEEAILKYERNSIPYYCPFCNRDVAP